MLYHGRDYPAGYDYFRLRLKKAFEKNKQASDAAEIAKLVARGEFVIKELDALYKLKKYRYLKRSYYDEPVVEDLIEPESKHTGSVVQTDNVPSKLPTH